MGSGFGIALMVLGVIAFLQGNIIGGMWWFLIGIFLRGAAAASYQRLMLHEMLHHRPISEFMTRDPVTVPASTTISELLDDYVYRYHLKMFPVIDGDTLEGCVRVDDIKRVPRAQWGTISVREIMAPSDHTNTVPAGMEAEKLLAAMVRGGRPARYMVVENARLAGIVSLKDVLELIALKMELESPQGDGRD